MKSAQLPTNNRLRFQFILPYLPLGIAISVTMVLGIFAIVSYRSYTDLSDTLVRLRSEVADVQRRADIIRTNAQLTKEEIDNYNQLLTQLIPEQEDYFTILYSLEQLSQKTQFNIVRYEISLVGAPGDKVSLVVEGDGNADAFVSFLKQYPYAGGRFITIERLEYAPNQSGRIRVSLNFYNKKTDTTNNTLTPLTPTDMALMKEIQAKTTVIVKSAPENVEYDKKQNPFSFGPVPSQPAKATLAKPTVTPTPRVATPSSSFNGE